METKISGEERRSGMTMGEFRALTKDVPDDWRVTVAQDWGDGWTHHDADASVDLTNRCVDLFHD